MNPIWKDIYANLGTADSIRFRVKVWSGSTWVVVYEGISVERPGASTNQIRINEIVADKIKHTLPPTSWGWEKSGSISIAVDAYNNDAWASVLENLILADWSYDRTFNPSAGSCISYPINRRAQVGQMVYESVYEATGEVDITIDSGEEAQEYVIDANGTGALTYVVGSGDTRVILSSSEYYDIVDGCNRYALLYVNAFGGWDSFLIEGNTTETDSIERSTRQKEYDNRENKNRGKENYLNEITKGFTFHTGYLSDAESLRMPHLLNSTEVYLQDIVSGSVTPVVLTNTSTEYKTYKSTGAMVNYEIAVEVAHNYTRR